MSDEPQPNDLASDTTPIDGSNPASAETSELPAAPVFTQPIVAAPDPKFFIKRMVIGFVVLGVAGWFLYDGFVRYPAKNAHYADLNAQMLAMEKTDPAGAATIDHQLKEIGLPTKDRDIQLNKIIGMVLIPVGLYLLAKFLRENKGELRLEDDVVHVPGHPPVPIASITGAQNARWDRKGVALFDYKLADGTSGRFKIDDFVFTRPPTDAIHDELIAKMPKA